MSSEPTREYLKERLQENANMQPMTVYCGFCPKWSESGTAEVTRALAEAHRLKEHPHIKVSKRIAKKGRAFSTAMSAEREAQIEEERRQRMRALGIG